MAQDHGAWSVTDSLNYPRDEAASVSLANGNILVSGGAPALRLAEIFDYNTEKWHLTDSMVIGRSNHKLIRLANGNILAIGGYQTRSCEIYDTTTKSWSLTDSMHYRRSWGETATLLNNGKVLVTGGHLLEVGLEKNLRSCELYNPQTGKWDITDSLKKAKWGQTATKLQNGKVLVAGGSGSNGAEKDCELYDPSTGRWSEASPLHIARSEHAATLLSNGNVLVTGGSYNNNNCEVYDPSKDTWTVVGSLYSSRLRHSAVLLKNGLLLITGGAENTTWELYNPQTFTRVYEGEYPGNQIGPIVQLLPNGKVLSGGGKTEDESGTGGLPVIGPTRVCYLYNPYAVTQKDLQDALSYYPLKIGDRWQYRYVYFDTPAGDSGYVNVKVTGDTLMSNNHRYQILRYHYFKQIDSLGTLTSDTIKYYYDRVDSSNDYIYRRKTYSNEILRANLLLQEGDTTRTRHETTTCYDTTSWKVFGSIRQVKLMRWWTGIMESRSYSMVKGIGITRNFYNAGTTNGDLDTLIYAKINGKEYGHFVDTSIQKTPTSSLPSVIKLYKNYPNPFNPTTTITYLIPEPSHVSISVYNVLGRKIATLVNEKEAAGHHSIKFHANALSSGVYFYRIAVGKQVQTRKMLLLK